MKKLLLVGTICAALLPIVAQARGGGFGFAGGPRVFVGGGFGGYGGYGPYGPYGGYGGVYGPYGIPNSGRLKIDTPLKDAEVFIDGSFAGTVRKLKTVTLKAGHYDIEIRAAGYTPYQLRIYVVNGKTLILRPDLRVAHS
jgi:hypothetical protein